MSGGTYYLLVVIYTIVLYEIKYKYEIWSPTKKKKKKT